MLARAALAAVMFSAAPVACARRMEGQAEWTIGGPPMTPAAWGGALGQVGGSSWVHGSRLEPLDLPHLPEMLRPRRADRTALSMWMRKADPEPTPGLVCNDVAFGRGPPPRLVVFDFDQTLTVRTSMPNVEEFGTDPNFRVGSFGERFGGAGEALKESIVQATYETAETRKTGARLKALKRFLGELVAEPYNLRLAVLTMNARGGIAVLNSLKCAGLDQYFDAIWAIAKPYRSVRRVIPPGLERRVGLDDARPSWEKMTLPVWAVDSVAKAEVLSAVASYPSEWLPRGEKLAGITMESIVLVDDRDENVAGLSRWALVSTSAAPDENPAKVLGGIGAFNVGDYETFKTYISSLSRDDTPPTFAETTPDIELFLPDV